MNEVLEAKLTMARIKVKLLDLAGELVADSSTNKDYALRRILSVVEYMDEYDIKIRDIEL